MTIEPSEGSKQPSGTQNEDFPPRRNVHGQDTGSSSADAVRIMNVIDGDQVLAVGIITLVCCEPVTCVVLIDNLEPQTQRT
jgi:hypothetical protein